MGSLVGFHHPQFSEALLPTVGFSNTVRSILTETSQAEKLLLSNALVGRFHLHLSSDDAEDIGMPLVDATQTLQCASGPIISKEFREGKANKLHEVQNACVNRSADFGHGNVEQVMESEAHLSCSHDEVVEVVELSIAASEGVLIHEIISGLVSDSSLASKVLEAASQLKEARSSISEEAGCSGNVSNVGYLSDLEDSSMAEAYDDVGLSIACSADLHTNQFCSVEDKDEHTLKNDMYGGELKYGETRRCIDDESHKRDEVTKILTSLKDSIKLDISCIKEEQKLHEGQSMCLGFANLDCQNQALNYSVQDNLHVPDFLKEVDINLKDDNHIEAALTHSPVQTSEDAGKYDKLSGRFPANFKKRWYGDWTWKEEIKYSAPIEHQSARDIPELFVDVTSFLSESADAAPDENSFVQGQATGTFTASQLSTGAQVIDEKTNEQTQLSEDLLTRSSLPSNDPLCSVVPCSISCHDMSSSPILENDGIRSGRHSTSSTKYPTECIPTVATPHDKLACAEESTIPFTQAMLPALCRRLTTLRPDSVLLHGQSYFGSPLNKTSLECLPKLLAQSPVNNFSETSPVNTFEKICKLSEDAVISPLLKRKEKDSPLLLNHGSQHYSRALRCDSSVQQKSMVQKSAVELLPAKESHMVQSIFKEQICCRVPGRKRVRFIDPEDICNPKKKAKKQHTMQETCYSRRTKNCPRYANQLYASRASGLKRHQGNCGDKDQKRMIFQNIEFLLTGFCNRKEKKLEVLIRKYSGIVLTDIPASQNSRFRRCLRFDKNISQVVISPKKLQTVKFLFGCAVNAFLLKQKWVVDSVAAGFLLPPERYSILPTTSIPDCSNVYCGCSIFGNAGVMLHGKNFFCTEMAKVIQYGGGQVFTSLQSLTDGLDSKKISFGVIVAENESSASRHLKHCAMEQKIPMVSNSWIIKSLHKGKLLPCEVKNNKIHAVSIQNLQAFLPQVSEEI